MGKIIQLEAGDRHAFDAYRADPGGKARGGLVVIAALRTHGRVGIVGFCVGGSAAWLAACRLDIDAAACYDPSDIGKQYAATPRCPVIMHFAEQDRLVSAADRDAFRGAHPDVPTHVYPAEHGFNNWHRPVTFDRESADLARERTLAWFAAYVGNGPAR